MPEKVIQLSKSGSNPPSVNISIQGKDVVTIMSDDEFCVSSIAQQPGGECNPFARPLPWPQQGCKNKVTSGTARDGTKGTYKLSGAFSDGTPYDPIIIIDQ